MKVNVKGESEGERHIRDQRGSGSSGAMALSEREMQRSLFQMYGAEFVDDSVAAAPP